MSEDAIQLYVSDNDKLDLNKEEAQEERRMTPQLEAMEAIAKKLYGEDVPDEVEEVQEVEKEEPVVDKKVKVKVDGVEEELSIDEIVKGYQKDKTASKRLEEAARLRAQLEAERDSFLKDKWEYENTKTKIENAAPVEDLSEKAKRIYKSLLLEDEEQGVKALTELIEGRKHEPAIPVDQVANQAAERARVQIEYSLAERKFKKDFADLTDDPDLYGLAMNYLQNTAAESTSYEEAFVKAGELTRDWIKSKAEKFGYTHKDEGVQSKVERKQSLDNVKPANVRTPAKKAEKELTTSEIIAEMRKQRGLR